MEVSKNSLSEILLIRPFLKKKCTSKEKENLDYLTLVTKGNHTKCIITWILYLFISQNRDWEDKIFLFVNVKYNHSLWGKKKKGTQC